MKKVSNTGKIIIVMVVFFILFIVTLNYSLTTISKFIDREVNDFTEEADAFLDGITCEFTYKDLHYDGICSEELIDGLGELVEYDRTIELLKICVEQPYAYRWELCEDLLLN